MATERIQDGGFRLGRDKPRWRAAQRPRDEPPGQPRLVSRQSQTLGWPGRLHRVVRRADVERLPHWGPTPDCPEEVRQASKETTAVSAAEAPRPIAASSEAKPACHGPGWSISGALFRSWARAMRRPAMASPR